MYHCENHSNPSYQLQALRKTVCAKSMQLAQHAKKHVAYYGPVTPGEAASQQPNAGSNKEQCKTQHSKKHHVVVDVSTTAAPSKHGSYWPLVKPLLLGPSFQHVDAQSIKLTQERQKKAPVCSNMCCLQACCWSSAANTC